MKIKLRTTYAGPAGTGSAGSVMNVPDDVGRDLVAGGYAEDLTPPDKPQAEDRPLPEEAIVQETTRRNPPERTLSRRGPGRRISGE